VLAAPVAAHLGGAGVDWHDNRGHVQGRGGSLDPHAGQIHAKAQGCDVLPLFGFRRDRPVQLVRNVISSGLGRVEPALRGRLFAVERGLLRLLVGEEFRRGLLRRGRLRQLLLGFRLVVTRIAGPLLRIGDGCLGMLDLVLGVVDLFRSGVRCILRGLRVGRQAGVQVFGLLEKILRRRCVGAGDCWKVLDRRRRQAGHRAAVAGLVPRLQLSRPGLVVACIPAIDIAVCVVGGDPAVAASGVSGAAIGAASGVPQEVEILQGVRADGVHASFHVEVFPGLLVRLRREDFVGARATFIEV